MSKRWKFGEYCDRCNNTGEVDCHCGGDLCVCGRGEITCPRCDGMSGGGDYLGGYDDDDYMPCPTCRGSGTVNPLTAPKGFLALATTTCPMCEGTGEAP